MEWDSKFMQVFRNAVARFHEHPGMTAERLFLPDECQFFTEIGHNPGEVFDYVKDYATLGDPAPNTILLIAAARRSFFVNNQRGISGNAQPVTEEDLPTETDDFQGITYLPRIMRKAEAKLHGTLGAGLMFYCAKDRAFLREIDIHPIDFLQLVLNAHGDRQKVVTAIIAAIKNVQNGKKRGKMVQLPHASQGELALD